MASLKPIELPSSTRFLVQSVLLFVNFVAFGLALNQFVRGAPLMGFAVFVVLSCSSIFLYFFEKRHLNPAFKEFSDRFVIKDALSLPTERTIFFSSIHEIRLRDSFCIKFILANGEVSFELAQIDKSDREKLREYLAAWAEEHAVLTR